MKSTLIVMSVAILCMSVSCQSRPVAPYAPTIPHYAVPQKVIKNDLQVFMSMKNVLDNKGLATGFRGETKDVMIVSLVSQVPDKNKAQFLAELRAASGWLVQKYGVYNPVMVSGDYNNLPVELIDSHLKNPLH